MKLTDEEQAERDAAIAAGKSVVDFLNSRWVGGRLGGRVGGWLQLCCNRLPICSCPSHPPGCVSPAAYLVPNLLSTCFPPAFLPARRRMARKEYEYEVVWVGQPNNPRNNTWKGKQELIDLGLQKMVGGCWSGLLGGGCGRGEGKWVQQCVREKRGGGGSPEYVQVVPDAAQAEVLLY